MTALPEAAARYVWRRSSYCENGDGACLEVSDGHPNITPVRDSKTPHAPAILFPNPAWSAFVTAVKDDELP